MKLMPTEVWPVVASVAVAAGASGYALKRKWFNDPQITFAKSKRSGGTSVAYGDIDEAPPFWSSSKSGSITIFGPKANPILDNKLADLPTEITVTIQVDGDEEEEEVEELKVIESEDDIPPAPESDAEESS